MKKSGRGQLELEGGSEVSLAVLVSCSEARRNKWHIIFFFFFRNMGKAAHFYLGGVEDL